MIPYLSPMALVELVWGLSFVINFICWCILPVAFACDRLFEMDDFEQDLCVVLAAVFLTGSVNPGIWPLGSVVGLFLLWRFHRAFRGELPSLGFGRERAARVTPEQPPELPAAPSNEAEPVLTPEDPHEVWPPPEAFRR